MDKTNKDKICEYKSISIPSELRDFEKAAEDRICIPSPADYGVLAP